MTVPVSIAWVHDGISEREAAHYWPNGWLDGSADEDCTWDSALMWYRMSYDPTRPSTHYEAERLRQASGEDTWSGSNPNDIRRGILARYGRTIPQSITGWSNIKLALGVGRNGMISGRMGAFAYSHRLRRFQPTFDGNHAVHAAKVDSQPRYWVTNPLAFEDHDGEWWTEDELRRYVQAGYNLWSLVAKTLPKPAGAPVVVRPPVQRVTVAKNASYWEYTIHGTRSTKYTVTRVTKNSGLGFTAMLGVSRITTKDNPAFTGGTWAGRQRKWAKIVSGPHTGDWINLLEGPNITVK